MMSSECRPLQRAGQQRGCFDGLLPLFVVSLLRRACPCRVRLLDEVEFDWEGPMRRQWEDKIAELEAFKRQFGHVMTASVPEGKKLTGWIKGLRQQDRMGKLREVLSCWPHGTLFDSEPIAICRTRRSS